MDYNSKLRISKSKTENIELDFGLEVNRDRGSYS